MQIISEIKTLIELVKYGAKNYSLCRSYQSIEFKKLKLKKKNN